MFYIYVEFFALWDLLSDLHIHIQPGLNPLTLLPLLRFLAKLHIKDRTNIFYSSH